MSEYDKDKLEAVELEIKTVKARKLELQKKAKRPEGLTTDEQVELEDLIETLQELKQQRRDWIEIIKLATKEEAKEESKSFREADGEWISSITSINTAYRQWTTYHLDDSIYPSEQFYSRLKQSVCLVHMKYEAGRRFVLNDFLLDVLYRPEFKESLRLFPEIRMEVSKIVGNKKRKIIGDTDYTIGLSGGLDIFDKAPIKELHLIAIEAKVSWDENDYWQCVAETATLFKSRKDAGKKRCSVWGVLSNATLWQFIFIDEEGLLWTSDEIPLNLRLQSKAQIVKVYRFLYFLVKSCFDACTPNSTPSSSLDDITE
ncbi:hypothetical protein HDV06_003951 [Boothiomyces sp. JEL0866]|nr:hypothetical protein HDV06_003951 [Boothiomyces sp. JEL0866]